MAGAVDQTDIKSKRTVYDLDAIALRPVLSPGTLQSIASAQRSANLVLASIPLDVFKQLAEAQQQQARYLTAALSSFNTKIFEDLRKTLNLYDDVFKAITLPSLQLIEATQAWQKILANSITAQLQQSIIRSLEIKINFELPRVYIPSTLEEAVIEAPANQPELAENNLLSVTIDQFGSFIIGGQKIVRANANSSRHGKLLSMLEVNKGQMVSKDDIKASLKVGDPKQIMKDLKKELRQLGFKLDYEPYRYQGLVYHGIVHRQQ